jgi:hypothetical protein
MADGNFWIAVMDRYGSSRKSGQVGVVRLAVLFASAAIVSAVILTPILAIDAPSARIASAPGDYDTIITGSIPGIRSAPASGQKRVYTIRKSVLQDTPEAICIIQSDGSSSGNC